LSRVNFDYFKKRPHLRAKRRQGTSIKAYPLDEPPFTLVLTKRSLKNVGKAWTKIFELALGRIFKGLEG